MIECDVVLVPWACAVIELNPAEHAERPAAEGAFVTDGDQRRGVREVRHLPEVLGALDRT